MSDSLFVGALHRLSWRDFRTLGLATLGGLLEFYDFIIFVFFASIIGDLFFPHSLVMPLYALAGLSVGIVAVVPTAMVTAFPPQIRFSGVSFSYNIGYAIFGGLTPILISWLIRFDALVPAYYVGVLSLVGCGIGCFLAIRIERKARSAA